VKPTDIKADLQALAKARVYFGHQSVGGNLLDGLASIATKEGVTLRIAEAPADDDLPGIIHSRVGKNRYPETKCDAFVNVLTKEPARTFDAAVLKFCYADVGDGAEREPRRVFEAYRKTVRSLRAARPELLIVHSTVPLNSDGLGKRNALRKFFGMGTSNDTDNIRRNEFNDLIRSEYAGEPVFDIASAQSTRPDGSRSSFSHDDRVIYTMAREFTYDEGHLTENGREWVAREFARAVTKALRERPSRAGETVGTR
jgi:hypothetical protein